MPDLYVTRQGDMIDAVCRRAYGGESPFVERVLDANPGLAARDEPLTPGVELVLPDLAPAAKVVATVKLWD